jgi:hypothetical protein
MIYGQRACLLAIAHVFWQLRMFTGHCACFLAAKHAHWPENMFCSREKWTFGVHDYL